MAAGNFEPPDAQTILFRSARPLLCTTQCSSTRHNGSSCMGLKSGYAILNRQGLNRIRFCCCSPCQVAEALAPDLPSAPKLTKHLGRLAIYQCVSLDMRFVLSICAYIYPKKRRCCKSRNPLFARCERFPSRARAGRECAKLRFSGGRPVACVKSSCGWHGAAAGRFSGGF